MQTLYDLLGARRDDDAESLKKAYRNAVKANHPDFHADDPGAAERFRQITAAYDILRDPAQRAAYDRTLDPPREPPAPTPPPPAPPRRRFFVSGFFVSAVSVTAATTVILTGVFLLYGRISHVLEGATDRTPSQTNAVAGQPTVLEQPIVAAPGAASPAARGGSAPRAPGNATAAPATGSSTAATEPRPDTAAPEDTTALQPWQQSAPAPPRRGIYVAKPDVDVSGVNRPSAPEKRDGASLARSYGPWRERRDPGPDIRTDGRTRGPIFADTVPPANKPAHRTGTVSEHDRPSPTVACKRWKAAAPDTDGSIVVQCIDKTDHAAGGNSKKTTSTGSEAPVEARPGGFNLGPLCLSRDSRACPIADDPPRR